VAELTPEQKQEMLEKAEAKRAAKQEEANLATVPAPPIEKVLPAAPVNPPTFNPTTQGVQEWGPYDGYEIVTTQYGQFAVPKGQVMHFKPEKQFNRREGVWMVVHLPIYRDASPEEMEYAKEVSQRQKAAEERVLTTQAWDQEEFGQEQGRIEAVQR